MNNACARFRWTSWTSMSSEIFIVLYHEHKRSYLLRSRLVFHRNYQRYCLLLSFFSSSVLFCNYYICKSVNRFLKRTSIAAWNIDEREINKMGAQFSSYFFSLSHSHVKTCFSSGRIKNWWERCCCCCCFYYSNWIESVRSYQNKNVWTLPTDAIGLERK